MCEGVECFGNHGLFVGPERERCGERGDRWVLPSLPGHLETPEDGGQAARVSAGQRWVRSGERKGQDRGKGEEGESLGTTLALLAWAVGGLMRAPWRGLVWAWCGTSLLEEGSPTWQPVPPPVAGPPFCLGPSTSQEARAESSLAPGPGRAQAGLTAIRSLWLLQ